jgi:hypothetical protein
MRSGVARATLVAGLLFVLAGCTLPNNQQASTSPAATPTQPDASPTPSTIPTPAETPTPESSPSPKASPSPAKLIITSVPFHIGEVGVTYGTVTLGAAGGVKPYKWSISEGALPPGLVLSSGGSTTGKPTATGTFSFVVRVDDGAGGAAGVPRSILVFRQLAFIGTSATCGSSPSSCALSLPYSGGTPGAKPTVKITAVLKGTVYLPVRGTCLASTPKSTSSPPPGMTASASGGVMKLAAGPPDPKTWCFYTATINFVLVNPSPCGAGFLCTSSNTLSVFFSL